MAIEKIKINSRIKIIEIKFQIKKKIIYKSKSVYVCFALKNSSSLSLLLLLFSFCYLFRVSHESHSEINQKKNLDKYVKKKLKKIYCRFALLCFEFDGKNLSLDYLIRRRLIKFLSIYFIALSSSSLSSHYHHQT